MKRERLEIMLGELAKATERPVGVDLGAKVKGQIPAELRPHRGRMDSISIMIDLRVSRLAAAAVIVAATVLFATFFGSGNPDAGLYKDSKAIIEYLSQANRLNVGAVLANSAAKGVGPGAEKDFVSYGQKAVSQDSNDLLAHWRVDEGKYKVIFADGRTETVDAEELIKLQAQMIRRTRGN